MFKSTSLSIFSLLATLSTLAFTFPIQPRSTISKFKEDLAVLSTDIFGLSYAVNSIGTTVTPQQELTVYGKGQQVQRDINTCNGDAKNIHSVSDKDANDVLHSVEGFTPTIMETLDTLGKKKNAFPRYAVPLVLQQLEAIHDGAIDLGNTLIALAPLSDKGAAINLKNQIDEAFKRVIAIYDEP